SILAIGAVSAESVDDAGIVAVADGDIQESVEVTDTADDLSTADTADETVGDDSSGPDDTAEYDLDDDTYSTYFNEDGSATDALSADGNYYLNVGTLTNKDIKIVSGQNVYIQGKEGAGIINNGTITIGGGAIGQINTVQISGITFVNTNKNAIVVNQHAKNVAIARNNFDLTYDDTYTDNAIAIMTKGLVEDVTIVGNEIKMTSAASYTYGLDLTYYLDWYTFGDGNAKNFYIAENTFDIESTAQSGMAEAMYLDSIIDSVIEGNNINVKTTNPGVSNYAMQVADSWGFFNDPWASSPYNVAIKDNTIVLDSADLAYGISVISLWSYTEDYDEIIKDMVISGNDVTITTQTEGVGISASSSDVSITDNKVTLNAAHDPVQAYTDGYIGNISYGIYVNNFNNDMGYFTNNTVTGNTIVSNVEAIKAYEEGDQVQPLTIEDNEASTSYLIDDATYDTYFNADGTIKDDAPIAAGDVLLLGDLTGKKLVIDTPITIRGVPNKKLVNCTVNLIQGADNSVIEDLDMEFTGDDTTGSIGIIYIKDVTNVTIQNNKIVVPDFVDKTGSKYGSSVYAIEVESGALGCHDIFINNNNIFMEGSCRYLYGIDVFKTWGSENRNTNINIFENYVNLEGGSRMAEAIYVSESDEVIVDGNSIDSTSNGAAYGVATDQLTNAVVANNIISVNAATQAYGITATTSGSDTIIRANDIDAKGTGAVGIGFNKQDGIVIEDNTIAIDGGDYTSITSSDTLGTANAAILNGEGNTNVEMSGNDVTETSAVRLDTVIEVSDMTVTAVPSGNGNLQITLKTAGGMALANQKVKVVFDNQVLELTTDANGVAVLSFALNKGGSYNVDVFYLGDDNYRGSDASAKLTINKIKTAITASGKTFLATAATKKLTATLKDANGNVLANKKVTFTVNGKTYTATTNAKGVATVKLALKAAKTYTVSIKFAGDGVYAASTKSVKVKLNKEKTKITAPKKTFKKAKKVKKVVITLKNSKGKAIAKKKVTLIVNKKKYTVKTNKKGKATFKVKLTKKGTFKYTAKFAGDTQYKAVKKTGKIKIK
ncbi:MAG: Ig-like domain repeat protein, partial [Methanobrevibacter sp.]|nr:Ig-like domain repeat protein [Methanobrevibacter sp.]